MHDRGRLTEGDQVAWVTDRREHPMVFADEDTADTAAELFHSIGIDAVEAVPAWRGYLPPGTPVLDAGADEQELAAAIGRVVAGPAARRRRAEELTDGHRAKRREH